MPTLALLRVAFALLALLPAALSASPIGLLTIVEGDAALLRDAQRHVAAEGQRLRNDDIVRTAATGRLLRIELADRSVFDLGPNTELLLQPRHGALAETAGTLYLAAGWLKVSAAPGQELRGITAPSWSLARVAGTVVIRSGDDGTLVFVESGQATLHERHDGRSGAGLTLKEGDVFVRRGDGHGGVARRLPNDWIRELPRGFADSLPRRAARFQATSFDASGGTETRYAELGAWLNGEPLLRSALLARFTPLARDREFRAGLVAELRQHPEWDRVLFPEKYRPKPPPPPPAPPVIARRPMAPPAVAAVPGPKPALPDTSVATLPADLAMTPPAASAISPAATTETTEAR
jgi:hypothetical protein